MQTDIFQAELEITRFLRIYTWEWRLSRVRRSHRRPIEDPRATAPSVGRIRPQIPLSWRNTLPSYPSLHRPPGYHGIGPSAIPPLTQAMQSNIGNGPRCAKYRAAANIPSDRLQQHVTP